MALGILYQDGLKEYDFGPGHPFRGRRAGVFIEFLKQHLAQDDNYRILKADAATEEDLLLICREDYIDFTREYFKAANLGSVYARPDLFYEYHSMDNMPIGRPGKLEEAARLVIGQAKKACDLVQGGEYKKVVSIGGGLHHAKPSYGEGFCLYNDVAFCGRYLLKEYQLDRILILDTDAHAGNGTSEYFYEEPKVLFIDLHQDPRTLYPGTGSAHQIGTGEGKGFTVNIPMPVGAGDDSYKLAFKSIVEPVVAEFKPQIMVRNGGSDPHFDDQLTALGLTVEGFRMIGEKTREIARLCDNKEVDLIASGYNERVLPYAWLALVSGVAGFKLDVKDPEAAPQRFMPEAALNETRKVLSDVKSNLKDYWACFR
jgi:acetoin utilization protein AcuC